MRFTNLLLWVQANELSAKFYKKLGFELLESDDYQSVVQLGSFQITLVNMRDEEPFTHDSLAGQKGLGMYVYIAVPDVDAFCQDLVARGLTPTTKPRDWPWGNREFIVKDPDGYKLCFWQPLKGGSHVA